MALAYLKYVTTSEREAEFEADIGTSTCYQYVIGKERSKNNGIESIDEIGHVSAIVENNGPVNFFNSAFTLKLPAQLFSRDQRFIQLRSYKNRNKKAIALSKVVEVYPQLNELIEDLPDLSSFQSVNAYKKQSMALPVTCRSVAFSFRESELSTPMFWQTILDVARLLAPQVVSGISNVVTSGAPNSGTNEEIVRVINSVIDALRTSTGGTAQPVAPAAVPVVAAPVAVAAPLPQTHSIFADRYNTQQRSVHSKQMIAPLAALLPLLLQNLPAIAGVMGPLMQNLPQLLGPIMERAPQLLQTVADRPIRLMNALAEFSARQRELNIQNKQTDQQHIERILADINRNMMLQQLLRNNPGAPVPDLSALQPAAPAGEAPPQQQVATTSSLNGRSGESMRVAISIQKNDPLVVNGKPKYVYSCTGALKLLLQVRVSGTDRVSKAIATLIIKNSTTRKLYLEKKFQLKDLLPNSIQELELSPAEVQDLPKNMDLITSVSLSYINKNKSVASGGTDVHLIYIAGEYFFKGFEDKVGEEIQLTDRNKYRVFWNKIWEGGTKTKKRWELALDAKYYLYYAFDKDSNGRVETRLKKTEGQEDSDSKLYVTGMLKSGMELSAFALNSLLPELGSYPSLSQQQLKALQTDELSNAFNSEALTHLEMRGRDEETGYIWVYPELCIYRVALQKAGTVNASGQITQATEEKVFFPKPTAIHFLGEKSK